MMVPERAEASGPTYRVAIVGGGSAGWIAAARMAAAALARGEAGRTEVTLIESPRAGPIGVGEGTWPTMRNTLARIGVSESDFLRETDAAFKQGARFVGWTRGTADDAYYHPLNPPMAAGELDLAPYWLARNGEAPAAFAASVDFQAMLCEAGRAPKAISTAEYRGVANYAYHLDAGKFAAFLERHATQRLGVLHRREHIVGGVWQDNGDLRAVACESGSTIEADLFVDCSGLQGLLIGGMYDVPLKSRRDILFPDRALALQLPYEDPDTPIACQTISTAQDAGWIWDIALWSRRGLGYVYSSAHSSDEEAEQALRRYAGPAAGKLTCRKLDINAGQRERFWVNNVVAVGLSAGFVEPLGASSLVLTEIAVDAIADRLPRTPEAMAAAARQFNRAFDHHWDRVVEFLKLHYVLTQRTDTAFWRDNVERSSIPDALRERLALWRHHPPAAQDFDHAREVFSWPSYQYILHGMDFAARYAAAPPGSRAGTEAARLFRRVEALTADALERLPDHRSLLAAVREHGLQRI